MKENFVELTKKETLTINGGMVGMFQTPTVPEWLPYAGTAAGGIGAGYIFAKQIV